LRRASRAGGILARVSRTSPEYRNDYPAGELVSPPLGRSGARFAQLGVLLFNLIFWPYLIVSSALLFGPALVMYACVHPKQRRTRWIHAYTSFWASHYLRFAPCAGLSISGRERVPRGKSVIFVSNHKSMVDILAVFGTYLPFLWVSKRENFYVPFIGWNMVVNHYVPLKRGHLPSIMRMVRTCLRRLGEGHNLFVFPEGTRSADGELGPFFPGAFRLAVRNRVPIVPMVLEGTDRVLPKKRLFITPHPVQIEVLPPVFPGDFDYDWKRLRDGVRERMLEAQRH
jgi:1-acyl-sn-glycerol-3-phosphate acyltransferase